MPRLTNIFLTCSEAGKYRTLLKELNDDIPNVTVWRVLRKMFTSKGVQNNLNDGLFVSVEEQTFSLTLATK
jgi:hypothetical protein